MDLMTSSKIGFGVCVIAMDVLHRAIEAARTGNRKSMTSTQRQMPTKEVPA
jgi:hypothetical protein